MISEVMKQLLNEQYHRELESVMQYMAMSSYFLEKELDGFANFFRVQAEEERIHADKQFDYIHRVEGRIYLQAIKAPQNEFDSPLSAFEKALGHEQYITKSIHAIVKEALNEGDFATYNFFQWFVDEQVEEEELFRTLITKVKLIGQDTQGIYLLNEELKSRSLAGEQR